MPRFHFTITPNNELLADGASIGQFASEAAAANLAIRFAQDNEALYTIAYDRGH